MTQANIDIGHAWERGELAVHEEHLYTEQIQSLLRQAIHEMYTDPQPPRDDADHRAWRATHALAA